MEKTEQQRIGSSPAVRRTHITKYIRRRVGNYDIGKTVQIKFTEQKNKTNVQKHAYRFRAGNMNVELKFKNRSQKVQSSKNTYKKQTKIVQKKVQIKFK